MLKALILLTLSITAWSQNLLVPGSPSCSHISRGGYTLQYNEHHEQPAWVSYTLTKAVLGIDYVRTGYFKVDPLVTTGTATDSDYKYSGYDRGHLAPSGDFPNDPASTFYYSNVSPQLPEFNRGVWNRLEDLVRERAIELNSIYVITGPIFSTEPKSIGTNKVSIPCSFYKVLLFVREGMSTRGIGFIVPHKASSADLSSFVVTVDSVEVVTGLDFFMGLEPSIEEKAESVVENTFWGF